MARLVKNIDTRQYGSLKAGRLLDGVLPESKIAELIASGHAKATDGDEPITDTGKNAENAAEALEIAFKQGYRHGYADAVNDAVDEGLISAEEASTCIFNVIEIDTDIANTDINTGVSGGDNTNSSNGVAEEGIKPEKAPAKAPAKGKNSKA
ncbi:hypothetical protein AH074_000863 [Salmonella enterica subsp. houtenae]|nr:hypothetical protein [Salmonella enterica subsp. enterica]EAW0939584.1 hypothetical protein [Salmonella enterica]EBF8287279.1 hypothetical protein [Salmonella enterica subsp. houtenae]ECU3286927.1 hypothetical protein [Salmonella enterica subsp. houtenae serovar Houten]EDS4966614.1 hypothetical protein [Salmonella enterica subsp. enterica serovar O rough]EHA4051507.1 hypothetical protein [Salmonella enterica subsp. enterica serovar Farmingdale]